MIEMIQAVAMLCNINFSGDYISNYRTGKQDRLKCQQEYIKCVDKKDKLNDSYGLRLCILERKKY